MFEEKEGVFVYLVYPTRRGRYLRYNKNGKK